MTAPSLPEFLLARVAEDEAMAERESTWFGGSTPWALYEADHPGGIGIDPRRVLRQCEAIRRTVTLHARLAERSQPRMAVIETLCNLAAIWSDHPDFQEPWST